MTQARQSAGPSAGAATLRRWTKTVGSLDPAVVVATATALVLTAGYLAAPLMGGDLAAQMARADFASDHPLTPVDLRWFGGVLPFGYSLWTPPVMAGVGVRLTGAIATVVMVALFTAIVARAGARRPLLGGVLAAVTCTSSLAEGRVTFACGLAAALLAVLLLIPDTATIASGPAPVTLASYSTPATRRALAAVAAVVAGAASPVAALLLVVAAAALVLRRRIGDALALVAGVLPLAITSVLFADGGRQVFNRTDALRAVLASALVVVLVPRTRPTLRVGAGVGLLMVAAAFVLPTPVGGNATRLSLLFALPVVGAFATLSRGLVVVAVAAVAVVQTPVTIGTLTGAGRPVTTASYYRPLLAELAGRGSVMGRVEVPELTGHWDAAYLARRVPLARGWLRQTDTELNDDVFYRRLPTAQSYRDFLDRNAVQFVAVADARPTYYGRRERTLIATGLPYLQPVWRGEHWTLYAVTAPTPVVAAPARLVSYGAASITLSAPAATDVTVRLRWFGWLTVSGPNGACLRRSNGQTVTLHTTTAGQYRIGSALTGSGPAC
ncbi:MAG: hypothetical protein ABJA87_01585 [bacterium]